MRQNNCEFCCEFAGDARYARGTERILFKTTHLAVVPSLGPLHRDHVLICTLQHRTNLPALSLREFAEFRIVLQQVQTLFGNLYGDQYVIFENGSLPGSEGGCSITHFHTHVIPLARPFDQKLLPNDRQYVPCADVDKVREQARITGNYLMVKLPNNAFLLASRSDLPSQFMRKVVASLNNRPEWDWRVTDLNPDWSAPVAALIPHFEAFQRGLERNASNKLASFTA